MVGLNALYSSWHRGLDSLGLIKYCSLGRGISPSGLCSPGTLIQYVITEVVLANSKLTLELKYLTLVERPQILTLQVIHWPLLRLKLVMS